MDSDNEAASQVAEHVEEAATDAAEAARETGQDGWDVVAEELRGLRTDIKSLMSVSPSKEAERETPSPSEGQPSPSAEPTVNVEKPTPPTRKVRRGHRKVTRHG